MPTVEVTTDPDPSPGGDPMQERLEIKYSSGRSSSPTPQSSPTAVSPTVPTMTKLAKVSDVLLFESEDAVKVSGRIHIKNISVPSSTLVFKIKTTNPDKFHVWPTIGLISDRGSAVSKVTLKPQVRPGAVLKDKFQVEIMVVPRRLLGDIQSIEEDDQEGNVESSDAGRRRRSSLAGEPGHSVSTLADLNAAWRRIAAGSGSHMETHRVTILVDPMVLERADAGAKAQQPPPPTPQEEVHTEWSERIQQIQHRLDNLDIDIMEQFMYVQVLVYILMGLLVGGVVVSVGMSGAMWDLSHWKLPSNNPQSAPNLKTASPQGGAQPVENQGRVPKFLLEQQQQQQQLPDPSVTLRCLDRSKLLEECCQIFG